MAQKYNSLKEHLAMTEKTKQRFDDLKIEVQAILNKKLSQDSLLNLLIDNYNKVN